MSSDADKFWDSVAPKLRKMKGFCPLTPDEAEAAFNDAPSEPVSEERIESIVHAVTSDEDDDPVWQEEYSEETQMQLCRNEGEDDEAAKKTESELEQEMLSDDDTEEEQT